MSNVNPIFATILVAHGMPESDDEGSNLDHLPEAIIIRDKTQKCEACNGVGSKLAPSTDDEPAHDEACDECKGLGWAKK